MSNKAGDNYLKKELYELIKTDESIFDFIQESSLDGLWYWDLENLENEWMNPKFWIVLGYNPEEMPHKSSAWQKIINQEDLKVATDNFTKHCENPNYPYDQLVRYKHKDGSTKWIRCRGLAIRDNAGKPLRMLGAHQDVTDIVNNEHALLKFKEKAEESEEKYRALYNNAPLSYQSLDVNGCFIDINPMWLKTLGYERDEVIGKWYGDFLHPDFVEHFKVNFPAFKKRGYVSDVQFKLRRKDGTYIYVSFEGCIGYTPDGEFKQTYCTFKDITEQKAISKSLQRSQTLLREAEILTGVGSWEWDVKKDIAYWSDGLFSIFKRNIKEGAPNWKQHSAFYVEEDFKAYSKVVDECLKNGTPYQFELRAICSDGEIKHCIARGNADRNSEHTIVRLWGTLQDITEHKAIEKELIRAKEKAEESDRLKTAFIQNMSHEIRTPMNAIMGFSSLLSENFNNKDILDTYSKIIELRCSDLLDIINDILDISKIESEQSTITFEQCNINELFDELNLFFNAYKERINKQHVNLFFYPALDNSLLTFKTDKLKLKQILINLVSNALKFTETGSITCSYGVENEKLKFYISDTGIGIPLDKHDFIFERFTQVKYPSLQNVGGTGLGLPIVKGLVKLLGGKVWLESKCNKGTTFYFTIDYIK